MLQNAVAPSDARFNSWAAFLLGMPSGAGKVDQLVNPNSIFMKTLSWYVQDTWEVAHNVTLALGLRWEEQYWPTRPGGKGINRFDPTDGYVYIGGYGSTPQDTTATTHGMFMPRTGFTYRFNDKTVFRAGFSRSADNSSFINFRNSYPSVYIWSMPAKTFNGVQNAYIPVTTLRQGLIAPAGSPDFSSGKLLLPLSTGTTTYDQDVHRGGVNSWNITVQRELTNWLTGQAAYVGTRAYEQFAFVNINYGAPGAGNAGRVLYLKGLTNLNTDINSYSAYGDVAYNGLQTQLRARSRNAQMTVVYTLSRTTNYSDNGGGNAAGAGGPRIQYLPEKERNKGRAGYDRLHNFQAFWAWNLPFGKNERWARTGAAAALCGGWQFNGIWTMMSGTPIYVVQNTAGNLNAAGSSQVPDLIKDSVTIYPDNLKNKPLAGADPNSYQYFDRSAYQAVNIAAGQTQRFGTSPRNSISGPNFLNVDLGLFRSFTLPYKVAMQIRVEALNAFNHANFANPGNNISDAGTFGFITSTTGNFGERNFRVALRFVW
jgi:hypothetical protein